MTATTSTQLAVFEELCLHLNRWFHHADIGALEVTLAVAASHYVKGDPTWLFVLGPPGTGKTSVNIKVLTRVQGAYPMGDLTTQTFLSGKKTDVGGGEHSLLKRLGSAILLMKDFTTILSKRAEDRAIIVSQLREIYDGSFNKDTGQVGRLMWSGKMTIIAACTPALERAWMVNRELGERFMTVRWNREDGVGSARASLKQRGHEEKIGDNIARLGKELLGELGPTRPELTEEAHCRIEGLAEIVAIARNQVDRAPYGERVIINVPAAEGPSRIAKALASVVVNYAALFLRDTVEDDMRLAVRLAMDSIPSNRYRILSKMPPDAPIEQADLVKLTLMAPTSLEYHLEELEALNLVERLIVGQTYSWQFSKMLKGLWSIAFPSTT
jgi:hypothetical protein